MSNKGMSNETLRELSTTETLCVSGSGAYLTFKLIMIVVDAIIHTQEEKNKK